MGIGIASMRSLINEKLQRSSSMINDKGRARRKLTSTSEAESGADRLVQKLNAPECRPFFCKVMYYLPAETRERILEYALQGSVASPKKYFTVSAKRELRKIGIF